MTRIVTDFECANGKDIQEVAPGRFRLAVDGDKQDGYGSYFCFDVVNDGPATEVTVELYEDPKFGGRTGFADVFPTTIWIKPHDTDRFRPLRDSTTTWGDDHCIFSVPVPTRQCVRVALTYVAPYSEVVTLLNDLAVERGDRCELSILGRSVEGREIPRLRAGTRGKPVVLCVAGQHPHEHAGVWGVLGIADFMSSLVPEAVVLRRELDVEIVPMVNPDGNVLGRNAFNAQGLDMYRTFGDAPSAPEPEAHESQLLWRWAVNRRPALWMNVHCFTGWRYNSEHPFEGWYEVENREVFAVAKQRRLYEALCDTVRLQTDAASTHQRASTHPRNTLCHQLAERYGVPHVFYELNNGTAGRHTATRRAIDVFVNAMRTLLHYGA